MSLKYGDMLHNPRDKEWLFYLYNDGSQVPHRCFTLSDHSAHHLWKTDYGIAHDYILQTKKRPSIFMAIIAEYPVIAEQFLMYRMKHHLTE